MSRRGIPREPEDVERDLHEVMVKIIRDTGRDADTLFLGYEEMLALKLKTGFKSTLVRSEEGWSWRGVRIVEVHEPNYLRAAVEDVTVRYYNPLGLKMREMKVQEYGYSVPWEASQGEDG